VPHIGNTSVSELICDGPHGEWHAGTLGEEPAAGATPTPKCRNVDVQA